MPKKTKNIKVTDRKSQKPWLRKAESSKYKIDTKKTNRVILIVCEGQTEKLYFKSFPVLALNVEAVDLKGQNKLKLIESTESIVNNNNNNTKYDEIWCVFDMDVKSGEKEFSDFDNAIVKGESLGYKIAYSNDSFELWFYLHYEYNEQKNHRTFYYKKLGEYWGINYQKNGKAYKFCNDIYNRLITDEKASENNAIKRAHKLFIKHKGITYHKQNPITKVYELVKYLNKNKRK